MTLRRTRHHAKEHFHAYGPWRSASLCAIVALLLLGGVHPSAIARADTAPGHVYVLDNTLGGPNAITEFARTSSGALIPEGTTPIGGQGSLTAFADGTQGSLILARTLGFTQWLFAADAGSDQISVVTATFGHLSLHGVYPSGGAGPVSLTYQNGFLYVLNAANGRQEAATVTGFSVDVVGRLHPIPGATRPLSAPHPNPAQVQIDPSGRFLLVTEKGTNLIDMYPIGRDGSLGSAIMVPSVGAIPFGMAFDWANPLHPLIVADAAGGPSGTGAATSYQLMAGTLHLLSGPVPDYQIAPCWMVVTSNGRFAYTSDADSHTISGYRVLSDGTLSLMDPHGVTASTPADTFPLEEAIGDDNSFLHISRFLYVLDSRLLLTTPGPATLSGYAIQPDGHLSSVVDPARITLPFSAIGLAAD